VLAVIKFEKLNITKILYIMHDITFI